MTDLLELAARCEAAEGRDTYGLLLEAFSAVHGAKPPRVHGGSDALTAWLKVFNPFRSLLEAHGYLDAALTLVPEGWRVRDFGDWEDRWLLALMNEDTCETVGGRSGRGLPALALVAAALRARSASHAE